MTGLLGFDSGSAKHHPRRTLSADLLPSLDGDAFEEVNVVSPDYTPHLRTGQRVEAQAEQINAYQVLLIKFGQAHSGDSL